MTRTLADVGEDGVGLLGLIPRERIASIKITRPARGILMGFRRLQDASGTIADILDTLGINGAVGAGLLSPIVPGRSVVGAALTLRYVPSRHAVTAAAADKGAVSMAEFDLYRLAQPGDMVVIDAAGLEASCMGGMSATTAAAQGLSGVVAWGGVRDVGTIRE